jgi:uncharacterized protein (TIGR02452 family)
MMEATGNSFQPQSISEEHYVDRVAVWHDTMQQCLEGRVASVDPPPAVKLHAIDVEMEPRYTETPVHVLQMDTADAAMDLVRKGYRPLLLNMSDYKTAGGAVASGSVAQEENLFRRSNYFKSLLQSYYPLNPAGTDVVFSPQICFFKDNEECHYQDLPAGTMVDCIACPAIRNPQIAQDPQTMAYRFQDATQRNLMKEKARMIFKTGYLYGHDVLVLSAHGCGAWGGPTHDIAEIYRELVEEYQGCFRAIIFAILGNQILAGLPVSNLDIFAETFYGANGYEEEHPLPNEHPLESHQPNPELLPHEEQQNFDPSQPPVYDPNPPAALSNNGSIPTDVRFG